MLALVDDDVDLGVEVTGEGMVDHVQPNDPFGRGDATPPGHEETHRSTVRRGQWLAVHRPDEQCVRIECLVERQTALHLREVSPLGDDVARPLLYSNEN